MPRGSHESLRSTKLRVTKAHKASFSYSVVFKKGDKVKVGRGDPEMPGWYWCEDKDGVWSWIPEEYLDVNGVEGTLTHGYDTTELSVDFGDSLDWLAEVKFWTLCRTADGRVGWVPTVNVKRVHSGKG